MRRGRLAFDGSMADLRALAEDVEYRLVTGDDARAADVCRAAAGIGNVRRERDGIRFDSRPEPVERLTAQLGSMGIGIRQLELPITALETLFFRLTETDSESLREEAA
jgi:ABC-2 type transport system ATP-binding protein